MYFSLMVLCFCVGLNGLSEVAGGALNSQPWKLLGGCISLAWAIFMAFAIHDFDVAYDLDRMSRELQRDQIVRELANE